MTSERVAALFAAAIELPEAEREAFLQSARTEPREVREEAARLIAAYKKAGDFLESPVDPERAMALLDAEEMQTVGPYRLIREVGRGGMGTVYLAERDDGAFEQRVALKLIKRGMDSDAIQRRFLRERQILARLEHPQIARLYDGGLAQDGRPYFAMEYVDGLTITQYCANEKLSVESRLDLFRDICSAVQYAHANLVIHRDLKASNILVTNAGEVKLLDFGIARLLDEDSEETRPGQRMMTPMYASPEQLAGRAVTTATDIYGLGLVLYELLTGHSPYNFDGPTLEAVSRVMTTTEPERPSRAVGRIAEGSSANGASEPITPQVVAEERGTTPERLRRRLQGDLDRVMLKALEKEPIRRYSSAEALSEDVARHVAGLPVRARGNTLGYRSAKFVRRHKVAVAATLAFAVLLIASGVALVLQQNRTAAERDKAEEVKKFVLSLFVVSDPLVETKGDLITARELLERGVLRIDQELKNQPAIRAEMLAVVGNIFTNLGRYDRAEPLLERALGLRREVLGGRHLEIAESLNLMAVLHRRQANYSAAEALHREALAMRRHLLGRDHLQIAESLNNLGRVLLQTGQYDAAEELFRQAVAMCRRISNEAHPELAQSLSNLGELLKRDGDYEAAEPPLREALAMRRELTGNEHPMVATTLSNLGGLLRLKGDYEQAVLVFREALGLERLLLPDEHPAVSTVMSNLSVALMQTGEYDEAEQLLRQALASRRKLLGDDHPDVASSLNQLGSLLFLKGDFSGAEPVFREALALSKAKLGDEHPAVANRLSNLAVVLREKGEIDGAESLFREALAMQRKLLGDEHPSVATSLGNVGALLSSAGAYDKAESVFREALALRKEQLGDGHPDVARSLGTLGSLLRQKGDHAEAESLLRQSLAQHRQLLGDEHLEVGYSLNGLGVLLVEVKAFEEAAELFFEAQTIFGDSLAEGHSDTALPLLGLGHLYLAQGRSADAESALRKALEIWTMAFSEGHWRRAQVQSLLGTSLSEQGRLDEAEALLRKGLAGLKRSQGDQHPHTQAAAAALTVHKKKQGEAQ